MKTKGFSIGIILLVLLACTACTKEEALLTPDGEPSALKAALVDDYDFSKAVLVYGPLKVERAISNPEALILEIPIPDYECYEPVFLVEILSGALDGSNSASSAIIKIDDQVILSQKDFNNKILCYSYALKLPKTFTLEITINGQPADFVTVEIKGIKICAECGGTFIDERDDREYKTVQIGNQCWMAENLKTTMYNDGTQIPFVNDNDVWKQLSTPAYCWYDNDPSNGAIYGKLYNWYAVNDHRGLAPKGWHVPSDAEWKILEMYIGMTKEEADTEGNSRGNKGGKLKEVGTEHWLSPNAGANNQTGFTALPGGNHGYTGDFSAMYLMCQMWSSTPYNNPDAWVRFVSYGESSIGRDHPSKADGKSIRCIKD
jgi:uncharacterized protein (TIGR02145 family)